MPKIKKVFEQLFHIHPDEFQLVQLFFLYRFCIGMFRIASLTAADALFLAHIAPENTPSSLAWVNIGVAVAAPTVTWVYDRLTHHVSRIALLTHIQFAFLFSIFLLRTLIAIPMLSINSWLYFGVFIWLNVCIIVANMLFFSYAGDYFTTRDAKRVYGYIAAGDAFGSIMAGALIGPIVAMIGTKNLLYFSMGSLGAGMMFFWWIHRFNTPIMHPETISEDHPPTKTPVHSIFSQLYIRLLFCAVFLRLLCYIIVDLQMKVTAKSVYPSSADLARFFGNFYMYAGILGLILQFLMVSYLLRRLGLLYCLFLLPTIHTIMSLLFYATGHHVFAGYAFVIITTANFIRMTLSRTLDATSQELLVLPLPPHTRIRVQAFTQGIILPMGMGIGSLFVMVLNRLEIPVFQYSCVVFGCGMIWLILLFRIRPHYRDILVTSLKNNQLDATQAWEIIQESHTGAILEELLTSNNDQIVSFTLDLLHDHHLGTLSPCLQQLTQGKNPYIAAKAVALLGAEGNLQYLNTIERAIHSDAACVREAAILAYCQLQGENALTRVRHWITHAEYVVKHAAIVGCGKYCGQLGIELAHAMLAEMSMNHAPETRIAAAQLIGRMQNPVNNSVLEKLLEDATPAVQVAAIQACGETQALPLIPHLLRLYRSIELQRDVLDTLEKMPEQAVAMIANAMPEFTLDEDSHIVLLQVLASIGGESAKKILWMLFVPDVPLIFRIASGRALWSMATHIPLRHLEKKAFDLRRTSFQENVGLLIQCCQEIGDDHASIRQLLHEHAQLEIEGLLYLLALHYHIHQIEKICDNLFFSNQVQRANAIELLDHLLPRRIAHSIMQLLDQYITLTMPEETRLSQNTMRQLMQKEPWLRVLTVYYLRKGHFDLQPPIVWTLNAYEESFSSLLDTILLLKGISLFHDVPGIFLVSLARLVHPIFLSSGEVLYHQGDRGDATYLVCEGIIQIQINNVEVNQVGIGGYVGEMAIIDGMPHSTSCIAGKHTKLLQISSHDFVNVLKSHPSVAFTVLHTLAERLRKQTADRVNKKDSQYHQMSQRQASMKHINISSQDNAMTSSAKQTQMYQLIDTSSFLRQVTLFHTLSPQFLTSLADMVTEMTVAQGEYVFHQGEQDDALYCIRRGKISVQLNEFEIAILGSRDYFGAAECLDGFHRITSAVALEKTHLIKISSHTLKELILLHPEIAFPLMQTIAMQLRLTQRVIMSDMLSLLDLM